MVDFCLDLRVYYRKVFLKVISYVWMVQSFPCVLIIFTGCIINKGIEAGTVPDLVSWQLNIGDTK